MDQIAAKLSCWKKHSLALAGRLTLAKSVIEAIPLYPMMTNRLPRACIDKIQKFQRRFVWGDTEDNRKLCASSCDTITLSKPLGGSGLRDLNVLNQVCLMKLGWNMLNHSNDLWCQVLRRKYNIQDNTKSLNSQSTDSSLWRDVVRTISLM